MSTVEEIETAIEQLPPEEYGELMSRIKEKEWDEEMEEDAKKGIFKKLAERAKAEIASGKIRRFP